MINLNEEEYNSGKYKTIFEGFNIKKINDFKEIELIGANILAQNNDESCIYLKEGKCSIHKIRPQVCRNFFCDSKDPWFSVMIKKIKDYKKKNLSKHTN